MKFTVYISNIEDGGKISLQLSLNYATEFILKKSLESDLINDASVKALPDGNYQAIACDDAIINPSTIKDTNNLANKEKGYIVTKDLTIENNTVSIG